MRTYLTQPLELWIANGGDDGNPGTQALPFHTHAKAWSYVRDSVDLGGQQVIFHSSGTTMDEGSLEGALLGQVRTPDAIFRGDSAAVRRPTTGRCFAALDGARFQFERFALDQSQNDGNNDASTITISNGSQVWQGAGVVFDNCAVGQNYDVQAAFHSFYLLTADWSISKSVVQTTAHFSPASNVIGVASPAGIVPFMGVTGVGNAACFVQSVSGALITLAGGNPGTSGGNSPVEFSSGARAHLQGDPFSFIYAVPNLTCMIYNEPYWIDGFFSGDFNAEYLEQVTFKKPDNTVRAKNSFFRTFYDGHNNAVLDVIPMS